MSRITLGDRHLRPGKIVCIGRNHVEHIEELGNERPDEMVVFCKPPSAVGDRLVARFDGETLHYEGEICLLIGEQGIAGAGFGLDLTRRQTQSRLKQRGLPWERAKAFDGAALFGPFAVFDGDPNRLSMRLEINGELRQQGGADLMLYPPLRILAEIRRFMRLEAGDVVMTGTPAGVGEIRPGDDFHGQVLVDGQRLAEARWRAE
jgi:2-keto-4-pentenoate hydratase/2-oxohepta-3-ene-1,7-dioic acid hydratase in catechol pathway